MIWDILLGREEPPPDRKRRASDNVAKDTLPPSPPATPTPEVPLPSPQAATELAPVPAPTETPHKLSVN